MDYGLPERADRLAAEYVIGSLRGPARRRFEALLPAHPGLRRAVRRWEERLTPLTAVVVPQSPSPGLWKRIEARIGGPAAAASAGKVLWWRQLGVWRAASALAGGAALGLALLLGSAGPAQPPPLIIVLAPPAGSAGGVSSSPSFVAGVSADGRSLVTRPLQNVSLQPGHSFELWSVPGTGSPRSLGLISANGATVVQRKNLLENAAALAVSLEPPGGSPTGVPTGPVVFVGKLTS